MKLTDARRDELAADEAAALALLARGLRTFPEMRGAIALLNEEMTAPPVSDTQEGRAIETSRNLLIAIGIVRLTLELDRLTRAGEFEFAQ